MIDELGTPRTIIGMLVIVYTVIANICLEISGSPPKCIKTQVIV